MAELRQEQEVYALYKREVDITPAMWAAVEARIEKEQPVRSTNLFESVSKWVAGLMGTPPLEPCACGCAYHRDRRHNSSRDEVSEFA